MNRRLKIFFNKYITFICCLNLLIVFVFMADGYSILTSELDLKGNSNIIEEEPWNPQVDFVMTQRLGNVFFYDIVIYNNSQSVYKDWQIKFYNLNYISYTDMLERRKNGLWMDNRKF